MAGVPEVDCTPTVPAFLHHVADMYGDRDFVVDPNRRLSYREAEVESRLLAKVLLAEGLTKGTRVAFRFGNTTEWITIWLALSRIGCISMPLSTMYRPAELRQILTLADAEVLITPGTLLGEAQAPILEAALPQLADCEAPIHLLEAPFLGRIFMVGNDLPAWAEPLPASPGADWASDELLAAVEARIQPADPMVIVFTSGTTSEPKAIIHSHGTFVRHTKNCADNTGEPFGTRVYAGMPFFWVGGLSTTIGTAMQRGQTLLCSEKPDPAVVAELLIRERADRVVMWPNLAERITRELQSGRWSADELPPFAKAGPPVDLSRRGSSLGMTETCAAYIVSGPADHVIPDEHLGAHGLQVPHMEYRIADPETGATLAEGEEGEICVRGYALMIGMYKKEPHEYLDADGWYHTGDRGRLRGPYIWFTGRLKSLIKSSGANVSPREVEAVLNACDGVLTSVVVGLPDARRQEIVGAAVVGRLDTTLDTMALVATCKEQLSSYKVPRQVLVLTDDELPLLATGKPDLEAVKALLIARGEAV